KIPKFQRDFVWTKEQTAKLIDSIIKGFPIGTFIFWKTREELRHIKNIGNFDLPDIPKGDAVYYVLDGQQRITSLYAVRKGCRITKEGKEEDYKDISINLTYNPDEDEEIVSIEPPENANSISVFELLEGSLTELYEKYKKDELKKIEIYQKRLTSYDFSTILISDYPIDIACEIFTRINTGGKELSLFEIMVAKTYDQERNFDLDVEFGKLINNNENGKVLEDVGFETIQDITVLQCISAHLCNQVRRKDILKLNKSEFIDSWNIVKNGIFFTVDYIRTQLRIPVSQLLPYNSLIVPFTYFFIRNNGKMPSHLQNKLLTQYFWWASLKNRFSSGSEGKIALDLKRMDAILNEQIPIYRGEEINLTIKDINGRWFSTGDAFCKAILCLYAYFEPKSFGSNSIVKIDNSWLKIVNSKNYHHFFPRSYLKKIGFQEWQANTILNITIVDDNLNKRVIGSKSPSEYMQVFSETNLELANTMKTHLIDDLKTFGILNNDYETFIERRGLRVLEEIKKRLEPDI
ncbi:MAG: DUF262 domain-containing protein, partial [Candidatus Methanoperedens sp.]|nr:DUF262 domain-containing protein [Candidatus Methanoperedens sp.]